MLIKAGILIDGTGHPPQYNCCIAIEKGKIIAIGRETDFSQELVNKAVDYSSYTVLPGLIDAHVHLFLEGIADMRIRRLRWGDSKEITLLRAAKNLELTLKKGVTTVRDLGGPNGIGTILKQAVNQQVLKGPKVLTCNQAISVTGGHFHYAGGREADGPLEMAKAVSEQVKAGAECIKLMVTGMVNFQTENAGKTEIAGEEIRAAVAEARRFNRPVSVHANGVEGIRLALANGVQTIEHGALLDEATVAMLGDSSIYWTPTITAFCQMLNYSKDHDAVATLPKAGLERVFMKHCAMIKLGIEAGVKIIAGTDAGALGVQHGEVWQEIALLVSLGMSPVQAIAAATGQSAKAIGVERDTGIIVPGRCADLVVVKGSPLDNIQALRDVIEVYKDGINVYSRFKGVHCLEDTIVF